MANPDYKAMALLFAERIGSTSQRAMADFLAEDVVFRSPLGIAQGREAMIHRLGTILDAFPDLNITTDYAVAEDDRVALRTTMRGTQAADYAGIPTAGRRFVLPQIMLAHFENGRIIELEVLYDTRNFLEQLGGDPQPFLEH